jgi:hypothetical protein
VRKAFAELNQILASNLRGQISTAAEELKIAADTQREAIAFLNFRNRSLGHAGRVVDRGELGSWQQRGRATTLAFLSAYLEWVARRRSRASG